MEQIAGRKEEIALLEGLTKVQKSAFVAVYGRRRVGKTYLIRTVFDNQFCFQTTGLAKVGFRTQLANFHTSMVKYFPQMEHKAIAKNWFAAFLHLSDCLENDQRAVKIVFLDELPWFDTPQSNFISALEHFWNSFASARRDILLITCGSAAAWMVNNLINNHGGLHNRVTHRIRLHAFTLSECEAFFQLKNIVLDRYQLIQIYMAMGGIPFYLDNIQQGLSAAQNINNLCFKEDGLLRKEFNNLYPSLFKKSENHLAIVEALAKKGKGMTRLELIAATKMPDSGTVTRVLRELEESSFIRQYNAFGKNSNNIFQLSDFYSLFYLRFIKGISLNDENIWTNSLDNPSIRAWSGYAFEQVCLAHIPAIKKALGISGIQTHTCAWNGKGAQIDLVIDRRDHVINLCEMKFSLNTFTIDKQYDAELRQKVSLFREQTETKKALFLTMITTFGLEQNAYAGSMVSRSLTMDMLF
ncbi:MAG: ATP-binding protein [Saprospiraceae bacterium]|nr:ATP-binding protein [Saprospiraceae bacterium]